ncbi:MAG: ATPase, T2SS/T4P/T4SS family [Endomicrobiaceae bacterium]|nr:ATPase, T2SS/T4P/T4SS family [Endomicrobiaceae bacterium]
MVLEALKKKYLGEILLEERYVTKEQLDESLKESISNKEQLGQVLIRKGYITEDNLLNSLSISLGIEYRRLANVQIVQSVLGLIPEKVARKYLAVPLDIKNDILVVAMSDPANVVYKDDVQKLTGRRISVVLSSESDIKEFIEKYYVRTSLSAEIGEDEINNERKQDEIEDDFSGDNADSAPVIKYVNSIFFDAITKKASDIHLEPFEKEVLLRMRIDGVLIVFPAPQKKYYAAIVSRIKIMSELDIAERRLPQDGKCRIKISNYKVDIRVSILPTIWGEKVVLRILAKGTTSLSIDGIGFAPKELNFFKEAIAAPYGMVLVTGPTSSGKTTTLYSALNDINKDDINIVTAEDPVEYELRGINQVHVRSDIGLDFAAILRTFMRQDPDVILVGEIRDKETAQIAIQAALTGHLVFSTLHTNDTVSTISRMSFMGVESFLLADAVNLIIAQRLIRTICTACKKEVLDLDDSVYKKLGIDRSVKVYKGKGCRQCDGSGYKGRTAIFEMLNISSAIKKAIISNAGDTEIREIAKKEGIVTLRESAMIKLKEGRTTIEEVLSVTLKVE